MAWRLRSNLIKNYPGGVGTRDKVRVLTSLDVQGQAQQLTGLEIEVEVKIHFAYRVWYMWHIFTKMYGYQWRGG